ncbi:MAG: hypothetical protein N4A63_05120 [Vallitalea sp.]|nr:hypothetical protein [Vallitalea sp.]
MIYSNFFEQLNSFLYKTVTIQTVGSNDNYIDLTGTLVAIHEDYITLILTLGIVKKTEESSKNMINFNRTFNNTPPCLHQPGSIADIPISKIAAIIHY